MTLGPINLDAEMHVKYNHEFLWGDNRITARYQSDGNSFVTEGQSMGQNTVNIGTSMDFSLNDMMGAKIGYDLSKDTDFVGHTGFMQLDVKF